MTNLDEPDGQAPPPMAVEATAEAVAATVGLAVGGPGGALIGAAVAPYVLHVAQKSWDELARKRRDSVARMIGTAAERLDEHPQTMVDHAFTVDQGPELLGEAMNAAAATFSDRKVEALALAVANGLADDHAAIDDERLVVRALADIEEPHLRLLLKLVRMNRSGAPIVTWHDLRDIEAHMNGGELLLPILQTLERNGLVEENRREVEHERAKREREVIEYELGRIETQLKDRSRGYAKLKPAKRPDPERMWRITPFGILVLDHIDGHGMKS